MRNVFIFQLMNSCTNHNSINTQSYKTQYIEEEISCGVAVGQLLEKIRRPNEGLSHLVRGLHKKIKISELQAKHFFEKHGIKKTLGLR